MIVTPQIHQVNPFPCPSSVMGAPFRLYNGAVPKYAAARIAGRLQVHREGYAFLITDHPLEGVEGDVFLPPGALAGAMHGDRVLVTLRRLAGDGRAEGEVVKILHRANRTVVGTFRVTSRANLVEPQDDHLREWIEIPPGMEKPPTGASEDRIGVAPVTVSSPEEMNGMVVNAEILDFGEGKRHPSGRIVEILGWPGDFGVDVEIIIRKHHIPHRFPPEVLEQAQAVPDTVGKRDLKGRRDFRAMDVVTIDGETARDFDDAVWVDLLDNGHFALHVHIADVSHYVRPGSAIDQEAALRGNSVYFPDRAVPMLPVELSTGICSLNPGVDRLTLSALLEIDHRGEIISQEFVRGVIRSVERMTYTDVHRLLEGDTALRERYSVLTGRFERMRELALILNRKRKRRGSIDFDLPEPLIEFNEFGEMTGVTRSPRNIAHRLIEEFMLVANEAVASHLEEAGADTLYRVHEPPDPKRVIEFEEIASRFGVSLGIGAIRSRRFPHADRRRDGRKVRRDIIIAEQDIRVSPRNYQKLIAKIEGTPQERILSYLMLRSLKQARYSEENLGHFALAALVYTHFTSPIRRYPDLVVHRVLGAQLEGKTLPLTPAKLQTIARECSDSERRAEAAERELVEWKKMDFMAGHVGDEFSALIINTVPFGFFVELEDLFIEGLVSIDSLPGDRFSYHETTREIVGARTGRRFSIGDRITVRLDRVSSLDRKLHFSFLRPNER